MVSTSFHLGFPGKMMHRESVKIAERLWSNHRIFSE